MTENPGPAFVPLDRVEHVALALQMAARWLRVPALLDPWQRQVVARLALGRPTCTAPGQQPEPAKALLLGGVITGAMVLGGSTVWGLEPRFAAALAAGGGEPPQGPGARS